MAGANRKATRLGEEKFSYVADRTILDTAKIYVGEMVQQDANSEVAPATDAASVTVLGVSTKEVDNTDDGETLDFIATSILLMDNSSTAAIDKQDIGLVCYVEDAATVAKTTTNSNVAGVVVEVTSNGVFVDFDPAKKV
jgi:hypothetical protein